MCNMTIMKTKDFEETQRLYYRKDSFTHIICSVKAV